MNHAFYSVESHKHVQKSPFRESIVLKITDNETGILKKKDTINATYTLLQCRDFFLLYVGKLPHKTDSYNLLNRAFLTINLPNKNFTELFE